MTVIRLVNDAVDDIESEGMGAFLLTLPSPQRRLLSGEGLGRGVHESGTNLP